MEINLTLFVQMGNFLIAYLLLRYLFFKPALQLLQQIDQQKNDAMLALREHEQKVIEQRNQLQLGWQQYKAYGQRNIPTIMQQEELGNFFVPRCVINDMDQEQVKQIQADLERVIMAKVTDVCS